MQKINGYTEEEAKELVEFVEKGRKAGKTLTALFAEYGNQRGRARGSVRNYYYALMKNEQADERIVKLLDGRELSVGKIRSFTEEEADEAIRSILLEKAKGMSVRKAIFHLSRGDDKLMLRLQNKYRNTLKKNPDKIVAISKELFGDADIALGKSGASASDRPRKILRGKEASQALQKRLEKEINELYDRLARGLKEENLRLFEENAALRAELERLRQKLS